MNSRMNPALFARLLKLESDARTELLELLGTTPVDAVDLENRIAAFETSKTAVHKTDSIPDNH